jgi:carbon starvation protein
MPWLPAQTEWNYLLLAYCFFAALSPMWLLLQPRGALGGYFLYIIMVAGLLGIVVGGLRGELDLAENAVNAAAPLFAPGGPVPPLFPILFITIACGACSGFHSIVASGTTSKQLDRESDARPVAYGGMLLEALFAVISLSTVAIMAQPTGRPDVVFANGVALFIHHATFGLLPVGAAHGFALLCFATFIFDTLDACTRLARYVLMELLGWSGRGRAVAATLITLAVPAFIVSLPPATVGGQVQPVWKVFWNLFGTSNQLLAALSLLGVTVWLQRRGRGAWLTLPPTLLMLAMTMWSLGLTLWGFLQKRAAGPVAPMLQVEAGVAALLLVLAVWLVVEALLLTRRRRPPEALPVAA